MATKLDLKVKMKPIDQWSVRILILVSILLTIIVSFLVYNNYTIEYNEKLDNLRTEENNLKQQVNDKYSLTKSVAAYQSKLNELSKIESTVNSQFPDSDEIPSVLIQLNEMAEQSDVAISNLLPSSNDEQLVVESSVKVSSDTKILYKNFNITASSNFEDLIEFIYSVAKYPRVMQLKDIKINRVDDDKIDTVMTLTIFYVK